MNVALPEHGAQVIEGELRQHLLNGDTNNYDMERGFTRHPIEEKTEGIIVQLGIFPCYFSERSNTTSGVQSIINHIRLLLWDRDVRCYSYYVEASVQLAYSHTKERYVPIFR